MEGEKKRNMRMFLLSLSFPARLLHKTGLYSTKELFLKI